MDAKTEMNNHIVHIENRKYLKISGIISVDDYNEIEIHAKSQCGNILIKGEKLKIDILDLPSGELVVNGKINALAYSDNVNTKSFFKRMFS